MPTYKALPAVLCPTANHIHQKQAQRFQLVLFYVNLIPNVQIIWPQIPTSPQTQHQKLCVAGNFVMAQTERRTDESGGLSLSMIIHFPTIPLIVSLSTTSTHTDRKEYHVVECQWGFKVGAFQSRSNKITNSKSSTQSQFINQLLINMLLMGFPIQVYKL